MTHASNETQSLIKITQPGPVNVSENPIIPKPTIPFIDKLSLTLTLPDELRTAIAVDLDQSIKSTSIFQFARSSPRFKYTHHIALEGTDQRPLFHFGAKTVNTPDMRLEFNPDKMGHSGIESLWHFFLMVFPSSVDGWEYIRKNGRISRIDIAVDIAPLRMDEFLSLPHQGMTNQRFSQDGHLQTYYLGIRKGNQLKIYDKAAEQAAKKNLMLQDVVRIEKTLRNQSLSAATLDKLPNPFAKVVLIKNCAPPPLDADENQWALFQDSVQVRGLANALALIPTFRRTQYRKHLSKFAQHAWWDPEAIWKNWPHSVNLLK